jgi:hypothetical protein
LRIDADPEADCSAPLGLNNAVGNSDGAFDSNGWFDFRVPCLMHDYCWDLVRVGRPWDYDSVHADECNEKFGTAMREHCETRGLLSYSFCLWTADFYENAVDLSHERFGKPDEVLPENGWPSDFYEMLVDRYTWDESTWKRFNFRNEDEDLVITGETCIKETGASLCTSTRLLQMVCVGRTDCGVRQVVEFPGIIGGERLDAAVLAHCGYTSGCRVKVSLQAKLSEQGAFEDVSSATTTIPYDSVADGDQEFSWAEAPAVTQIDEDYYEWRFRISSMDADKWVIFALPTMSFIQDET